MTQSFTADQRRDAATSKRFNYERPRIQEMTEKQILETFQITQAMATWWTAC